MRLKDKIAIITGASRGLGFAMAELFAKEGATVIACDRNELNEPVEHVEYYHLDVTDVDACQKLSAYVKEKYGKIDILINNAGITKDSLTKKMTDEQWNFVIDINLKGVFNLTRFVGPLMQEQEKGSIINISSVVGEYGNIGQANYAATKAGVIGLTYSWAKEFSLKGAQVRVNAIAPGFTKTEMIKTIPQSVLDPLAKLTMLGRLAEPIEIANAALFLASDDASYITGHVLSVNGGMRL
jgi:3-oxoacyl-[acyl-carrier protein] reductase